MSESCSVVGMASFWERTSERRPFFERSNATGLEHHLGQFLDVQWNAVRLGDDLGNDIRRKRLASRNARHHFPGLASRQSAQDDGHDVRVRRPWRPKRKSRREQNEQAHGGHLVDQQREELHGRGIDPMDILHDGKYGPLRAKGDDRSEQRLQRSLLLPLRAHRRKRESASMAATRAARSAAEGPPSTKPGNARRRRRASRAWSRRNPDGSSSARSKAAR